MTGFYSIHGIFTNANTACQFGLTHTGILAVLADTPQLALVQKLVLADNPLIGEAGARALVASKVFAGVEQIDLSGCSAWSQQVRQELTARFGKRVLLPHAGAR